MEELRKIIREQLEQLEQLEEGRMLTHGGQIASDISRKVPGVEKLLGLKMPGRSTVMLIRYEDGNVYEIEITAGNFIEDRGLWGNILKKREKPYKGLNNFLGKKGIEPSE